MIARSSSISGISMARSRVATCWVTADCVIWSATAAPKKGLGRLKYRWASDRRQGQCCSGTAGRSDHTSPGTSPSPGSRAQHRVLLGVGNELPDFLRTAAGQGDPGCPGQRLLARKDIDDRETADSLRV